MQLYSSHNFPPAWMYIEHSLVCSVSKHVHTYVICANSQVGILSSMNSLAFILWCSGAISSVCIPVSYVLTLLSNYIHY